MFNSLILGGASRRTYFSEIPDLLWNTLRRKHFGQRFVDVQRGRYSATYDLLPAHHLFEYYPFHCGDHIHAALL